MPVAEVRTLCMSMGADVLGVACSWQSDNTCYIVYRTMNKHRLQLTDDTKSPIAMAGRLIILAMGEICPDRYVSRDWRRDLLRPMK